MDYPLPRQIYKHYKGGTYEAIIVFNVISFLLFFIYMNSEFNFLTEDLDLDTHTETGEKLVVYKSINFGSIYVSPLDI